MQPSSREMQGMASSLNGPAAQIPHQDIPNGGQQQIQNPNLQHYDQAASSAHDDFFDQMLSSLPWAELAGKPTAEDHTAGAEGLHYPTSAAPFDESALLASRLRQHQISGGGSSQAAGKPMVLQLNHHNQQCHSMISGLGRPAAGVDSGLLPLPLSLGSGDSSDPRLLVDRSRDEMDASFKSPNSSGGEGFFNGFGGSFQRAAQAAAAAANQQHFHHPQGGSMPSQNYGTPAAGMGQAAAGGGPAAGGTAAPRQRVRARRGQATDPHSIAERLRRERIAERMKALQELVPNGNKTDKASMLDEIIDYVKFLQLQVKVLSMSRLGGAAAVAPLVADISSDANGGAEGRGSGANQTTAAGGGGGDSLAVTEHQVAKMMEEDMGSAMQYLQGKGLCLMPISLASAISTATTCHSRTAAAVAHQHHPNGNNNNNNPLISHALPSNGDAPSSPSMSVLTVQSAMANGADTDVSRPSAKDAASVSKP